MGNRWGICECSTAKRYERDHAHPWLVWAWCYAHRLELTCSLQICCSQQQAFKEMQYHLYEKSPKKTRKLGEIMEDLKEVFELPKSGNIPARPLSSRWITQGTSACGRFAWSIHQPLNRTHRRQVTESGRRDSLLGTTYVPLEVDAVQNHNNGTLTSPSQNFSLLQQHN